jgi:hypothetical protein
MLDELKIMLGIEENDADANDLIELIVKLTTQRLKNKLGGVEVPAELEYIVFEVSVMRYNRIGAEGMAAQTIEGKSETFKDSDFDEFKDDIQDWKDRQENKNPDRGGFRFL